MPIRLGLPSVSLNIDHPNSQKQDQRDPACHSHPRGLDADTQQTGQSPKCGSGNNTLPQTIERTQSGQNCGLAEQRCKVEGEVSLEPGVIKYRPGIDTILADFLCLAAPIALLVFAVILVTKNGQEAEVASIEKWRNSASVLSTLFPFLFAAVVGRLMTQAARCKLENGSSIGTLEQLLGSRTVGGVVVTHFQLKIINSLAILLLLLWCISPLGSQAIIRLVEVRSSIITTYPKLAYYDTVGAISFPHEQFHTILGNVEIPNAINGNNALYTSMIVGPTTMKNHSMDIWGNIKIPFLTPSYSSRGDLWQSRRPGPDMVYSSLVGLPVANIPSGSLVFEIESTYIKLDCGALEISNSTHAKGRNALNSTWLSGLPALSSAPPPPNGTFQGFHLGGNGSYHNGGPFNLGIDRFVDYHWLYEASGSGARWRKTGGLWFLNMFENETGIEVGPTNMMFEVSIPRGTRDEEQRFYGTTCVVRQNYVTSRILCSRKEEASQRNCTVIAQRPSRKYAMPESLSTLNFPDLFYLVSKFWPAASGRGVPGPVTYDFTLLNLMDPAFREPVELSNLSPGILSLRLSQMLNTYIQITSMSPDEFMFGSDGMNEMYTQRSDARKESSVIIFFIPTVWAALFITSDLILLVAGAMSVFFVHRAIGPEVLGYATTALRNNSLIAIPESAKNTDGMELALQLRRRRVRLGLVRDGANRGTVLGISDEYLAGRLRDSMAKQ